MKRTVTGASLIVLTSCAVFAQTNPPAFEVATVKQAPPPQMGRMMVQMGGDPGRVDYKNVSLKDVLARAYGVKPYQITGPSWLDERYDIMAKVPEGVATDQVPAMLQALLAERFKMVCHKESKEGSIYSLSVGKGGPKLTKADENSEGPVMMGPDGTKLNIGGGGRGGPGPGAGGPGPGGPGRGGAMMMSMGGPGGTARMQMNKITMASFAESLSRMLGTPVTNATGIEGIYDIALDVSMEDMAGMRAGRGGPMMMGGPGGPGGPGGADHGPAPDAAPAASIFQAIQGLGLKLEPKKGQIEHLVVDKGERVPTEN